MNEQTKENSKLPDNAMDAQLASLLITGDGKGIIIKSEALTELLRRTHNAAMSEHESPQVDGMPHCTRCGAGMRFNVPRMGPDGGYVHAGTGRFQCADEPDQTVTFYHDKMTTPKKLRCYYAHCVSIYCTHQEKRDIDTLEALGFEVVNPNTPECSEGYKQFGMEYFQRFARALGNDSCYFIAFRGMPDGRIPAGVANEIRMFVAAAKPVMELPSAIKSREMSVPVTRDYLLECGHR